MAFVLMKLMRVMEKHLKKMKKMVTGWDSYGASDIN